MKNFGNGVKLFQLIPAREFQNLCDRFKINKGVRTLTAQKHVWVLILSYLCKLDSLRDIEAVFGIPKSTLSDANSVREANFFEELCRVILWKILEKVRARKVRQSIRILLAIDSTECVVHGSMIKLPKWRQKKSGSKQAGAKLHVIWNLNGEWVEQFHITPVRVHDQPAARMLKIKANCTYVFDRAYNELDFWWAIIKRQSHFVTRLRQMPKYRSRTFSLLQQKENEVGVLWDGQWSPTKMTLWKNPQVPKNFTLRHVIYRDPETKKVFSFVTSDFNAPAQEIADIYRKRWAVELLFRWLKGHLNIRRLGCRNTNAVHVQLATAVLVELLVQLYRLIYKYTGSLWDCLRMIRAALTQLGTKTIFCEIFSMLPPNPLSGASLSQ